MRELTQDQRAALTAALGIEDVENSVEGQRLGEVMAAALSKYMYQADYRPTNVYDVIGVLTEEMDELRKAVRSDEDPTADLFQIAVFSLCALSSLSSDQVDVATQELIVTETTKDVERKKRRNPEKRKRRIRRLKKLALGVATIGVDMAASGGTITGAKAIKLAAQKFQKAQAKRAERREMGMLPDNEDDSLESWDIP